MCIQSPTLQGSRGEYLKVRIKGDWDEKESRERKFR